MNKKTMRSAAVIGLVSILFTTNLVHLGSGILFLTDLFVSIMMIQVVLFERREA